MLLSMYSLHTIFMCRNSIITNSIFGNSQQYSLRAISLHVQLFPIGHDLGFEKAFFFIFWGGGCHIPLTRLPNCVEIMKKCKWAYL